MQTREGLGPSPPNTGYIVQLSENFVTRRTKRKVVVKICIIIVAPPHKTPDFDNIVQATWENDDGSGWVIRTPHGLEIVRSAKNVDHVVATFQAARAQWPDSWAVWHSRLATHGYISDENTHPFVVPGTDWALVHNGIMQLNDGPFSDRSDSRILAEDHVATQTWEELRQFKSETEKWLQSNKVVVISGRKERGGPVIIFNENLGQWDKSDGCWYSHPLYWTQYSKWYQNGYTKTTTTGTGKAIVPVEVDDEGWPVEGETGRFTREEIEEYERLNAEHIHSLCDPDGTARSGMSEEDLAAMFDAMTNAEKAEYYQDVFSGIVDAQTVVDAPEICQDCALEFDECRCGLDGPPVDAADFNDPARVFDASF